MTSFFQISQLFKNQRLGYSTDSTPYWIGIIASINDTLCLVAMWPLKTVIAQKEALYTVFRSSQDGYWSYNRPRVWGLLRQPMDPFGRQWHISKRGPPFYPQKWEARLALQSWNTLLSFENDDNVFWFGSAVMED